MKASLSTFSAKSGSLPDDEVLIEIHHDERSDYARIKQLIDLDMINQSPALNLEFPRSQNSLISQVLMNFQRCFGK